MAETVTFQVNDSVVYPAHGVGKIIAEEKQIVGGFELDVYVISFIEEKMTLRVPKKRANDAGLRKLSSKNEIKSVFDVLKKRPKSPRGMWSKRAQEYETKINSGHLSSIAEVVRDLNKNVGDPNRSYSERMIYESAFNRLVSELAAIENVDAKTATTRLTTVLEEKEEVA